MTEDNEQVQTPATSKKTLTLWDRLLRLINNMSLRLQLAAIALSLVGIAFGVMSYVHVRDVFGVQESEMFLRHLYLQIIIAIGINVIVAMFIHYTAIHPINQLNESMSRIANGELDVEIPYTKVRSQIGSTARKVLLFHDRMASFKQLQEEQERTHAASEQERKNLLEQIAGNFDHTVSKVVGVVNNSAHNMKENSSSVLSSMTTSNKNIVKLSEESAETSRNISNIASAAEELSVSIAGISHQVSNASKMAEDAVKIAGTAGKMIGGLSSGTEKIGSILGIIDDIAKQINLLSLNATIEAARAGEAGKGFAVVAGEVKNLASQTAKATQDIAEYLENIGKETTNAISFIKNIGDTINQINDITVSISQSMDQQGSATKEIAKNMQEAVTHAGHMNRNVEEVHQISEDAGNSAKAMSEICLKLVGEAETLNTEITKFITSVKAA